MLLEQRFKNLVDTTDPSISFSNTELESLYNHYGIAYTTSLSQAEIGNHLSEQIRTHLISKLQEFKIPRIYKIIDKIEMTNNGKLK